MLGRLSFWCSLGQAVLSPFLNQSTQDSYTAITVCASSIPFGLSVAA